MTQKITFEIWKGKRVIIIRENGRFVSRKYQKGSGIKSKKQAKAIYKKNATLDRNVAKISRERGYSSRKKVSSLIVKGKDKSKAISLKGSGFQEATHIGRNTAVLKSKRKIPNQNYNQIVATVLWGEKQIKTVGYSDIRGTPKQAFTRAYSGAIHLGLLQGSGWKISFNSDGSGVATKSTTIVFFKAIYSVQTYINSSLKTFKPQREIQR